MNVLIRLIGVFLLVVIIDSVPPVAALAQHHETQSLVVGYRITEGSIQHYQAIRLVEELEKRSGIQLEFKILPNVRSLDHSNSGIIDGEFSRVRSLSSNPKYPNLRIVDAPWVRATLMAIVKKGSHIKITGWNSLKSYKFCYKRGLLLVERMVEQHDIPGYSLDSPLLALMHLNSGRCEVTANWYERYGPDELQYIDDHDLDVAYAFSSTEGYLYLHKKWEALIPGIRAALLEMDRDGTRQKIIEESFR